MSATILIVDDEDNARQFVSNFLGPKGYEVIGVPDLEGARQEISRGTADIILLDVNLPDGYGPSLLYETRHLPFRPPIILITAYGDVDMAVDAMKNGAHDFIQKPIQLVQLEESIQRAEEIVAMRRELAHLRSSQSAGQEFVAGNSADMQDILSMAKRAAQACVSVLLTGETGTGKDVLARFIHRNGPRSGKPFIAINCAAIQPTVLESELFGYEAGAFTSAEKRKIGLMEVADGGILFLDEISSMPLEIQAKFLRAIEEQAFRRVGGTNLIKVDVQIIAASNRDVQTMIEEKLFRSDLYYRLKVVDMDVPPLRNRKADIPELVGFFIRQINARQGRNITDITPTAMQGLMDYDWPGNIRELAHSIERAMLFCDGPTLDVSHFSANVLRSNRPS